MENLAQVVNAYEPNISKWSLIGIPILFLFFSILSCIWFSISLKKKKIGFNITVSWLASNVLFLIISIYLFIVNVVYASKPNISYEKINFFEWLGKHVFGIEYDSWIILIVLLSVFITFIITLNVILKFNEQTRQIHNLNRNIAILKGKIAIDLKETNFSTSELSVEELEHLLEEKLAKEKIRVKYKNKLERLASKNQQLNIDDSIELKDLLGDESNDGDKE